MRPLKLGVLSVSTHYGLRVHLPLKNSPEIELTAIASRSLERAREASAAWGFEKAYGSYEDLLNDDDVEAVYIPLPNHLHGEWIKKAADAGKAVLCEKPLETTEKRARDAVEYAEKKGVLLMEAFMYRFHPQWVRARELISIGEIGDVKAIHTFFSFDLQDPENIRNVPEFGGGGILDIGCYAVSSARFLLGREPTRLVSLVERHPVFKTDVLTSAILDFGSTRSVFTVSTTMYPQQQVKAFGTGGTLTVRVPFNAYPDVPLAVEVETGVGRREIFTGPADQYGLLFGAFARAIRGDAPAPTPPSDALANMRALDGLFESSKSGGWVDITG